MSHIRGNRSNLAIVGQADDLETFMFHANRARLQQVGGFLREYDGAKCFYCGRSLRDAVDVDHFIPWSHYPRDTAHNFVLAHKTCNGRKRDTLAARRHLEHWIDRNDLTGDDFQHEMEKLGFMVKWSGTRTIARWAYQQGIDVGSHAWVEHDLYEPVDGHYLRLLE